MGSKRNVDMSANTDTVKIVTEESTATASDETSATQTSAVKKDKKARSKKYTAVRAKLDKTRLYSVLEAIKIVQELSYSKFDGTITADGVVKEAGNLGTLTFPNSTGKQRKVAIVDDALLKEIEAGNIDFDVLVTSPEYMPKLAKHARVLGPRGLMPNPKTGTLTPNPEVKKKELEAGAFTLKTEKKRPVIHVPVGKVSMDPEKVAENIAELFKLLGTKLQKLTLSATMSPGVRVDLSDLRKLA